MATENPCEQRFNEHFCIDLWVAGDNANLIDKPNHAAHVIDDALYRLQTDIAQQVQASATAFSNIATLQAQLEALTARVEALEGAN